MRSFLLAGTLTLAVGSLSGGESSPGNKVLSAYADMQYPQARNLAAKYSDLPESRLVKALCAVFDRKKQDLDFGVPELKRIYDDKTFPSQLRLQAGLSYARAAQTLQLRKGVYPIVDNINADAIYEALIKEFPDSPEACFAAAYIGQGAFESNDQARREQALIMLNDFIANYKGSKNYLAALHLLLANEYVIASNDFQKSAANLVKAFESGIANPKIRESVLFRIGRTYDLKNKDKVKARQYYLLFLDEYPNSSSSPVVKRYLKELDATTTTSPEASNG